MLDLILSSFIDTCEKRWYWDDLWCSLQLAIEHGIKFMETSAKASINVEDAFFTLARDIKAKMDRKLVGDFIECGQLFQKAFTILSPNSNVIKPTLSVAYCYGQLRKTLRQRWINNRRVFLLSVDMHINAINYRLSGYSCSCRGCGKVQALNYYFKLLTHLPPNYFNALKLFSNIRTSHTCSL